MDLPSSNGRGIDPITLEIQWSRLVSIMNEMDTVMVRTSYSIIVSEGHDFGCVLLDANGYAIAQSTFSTTAFVITLPFTVRHLLEAYPPETLVEGDILMTNDPWMGTGHLYDIALVQPVFRGGRPIAYFAIAAHVADIGGRHGYLEPIDVFEEGLQLPPSKLYKAGVPNEDLFNIIRANVRVPDQVVGDLRAIVAAEHVGTRRLVEFMDDYGLPDLEDLTTEIHDRSERAMRDAIRAMPDGEWQHAINTDGYKEPTTIKARVVIRGDELSVDFDGTSPETHAGAINCALNATLGDALVALKCSFAPDIPNNEGLFRPIKITAPVGSILNCRRDLPVRARCVTSLHTHEAIYGALAPLVPELVQAGTGTFWQLVFDYIQPNGRRGNAYLIPRGGKGAVYNADGIGCIAFPTNGTITPTEIFETRVPLRILEKQFAPDSGGPGRFRGGQGQTVTIANDSDVEVMVTLRPSNCLFPPTPLEGGREGPVCTWEFNAETMYDRDLLFTMRKGDRLRIHVSGGGGFGSPLEREPEAVRRDVLEDRVTIERAAADYGVLLDPVTLTVQAEATATLRREMA